MVRIYFCADADTFFEKLTIKLFEYIRVTRFVGEVKQDVAGATLSMMIL